MITVKPFIEYTFEAITREDKGAAWLGIDWNRAKRVRFTTTRPIITTRKPEIKINTNTMDRGVVGLISTLTPIGAEINQCMYIYITSGRGRENGVQSSLG